MRKLRNCCCGVQHSVAEMIPLGIVAAVAGIDTAAAGGASLGIAV